MYVISARVGQIPVHHDALITGRPLPDNAEFENFKSCYIDEINDPLFPFGFGLTYSTVQYGKPVVTTSRKDEDVTAVCRNRRDQYRESTL